MLAKGITKSNFFRVQFLDYLSWLQSQVPLGTQEMFVKWMNKSLLYKYVTQCFSNTSNFGVIQSSICILNVMMCSIAQGHQLKVEQTLEDDKPHDSA
jgi:hypothetical protein